MMSLDVGPFGLAPSALHARHHCSSSCVRSHGRSHGRQPQPHSHAAGSGTVASSAAAPSCPLRKLRRSALQPRLPLPVEPGILLSLPSCRPPPPCPCMRLHAFHQCMHAGRGAGWLLTSAVVLKASLGIGTLSLPAAFARLGWVPSLLLLAALAAAVSYSGYLYTRCAPDRTACPAAAQVVRARACVRVTCVWRCHGETAVHALCTCMQRLPCSRHGSVLLLWICAWQRGDAWTAVVVQLTRGGIWRVAPLTHSTVFEGALAAPTLLLLLLLLLLSSASQQLTWPSRCCIHHMLLLPTPPGCCLVSVRY